MSSGRQFTARLMPELDDWIRERAGKTGQSINEVLNEMLGILKKGHDRKRKQQEIEAMQAKIAAIRNKKAAPNGAAPATQAPDSTQNQRGKENANATQLTQQTATA